MGKYIIHPVPLCKGIRNKIQLTYRQGWGEEIEICCYVWYIQGAGPKILVDTGTSAEWYHTNGVPQQEHIQYLDEGLQKFGVQPEDIDIVILTHLHADHVEQARKFNNARFIVQREELEAAKHPAMATEYIHSQFEGLNFEVIDGDTLIVDGITTLYTPGHTPGTQSVAVETSRGTAVISGFCSIEDNFGCKTKEEKIFAPGVFTNLLEAYDSIVKVKQAANIVIPLHDMEYAQVDAIP